MKLYYATGACSLAPHIVVNEGKLDVGLERVIFPDHKTEGGRDYYSINPMGAVPALELENGELLTENAVLLQYLAQLKPEANLAPKAGTMEHWRFLETLNFIATELHKTYSPLFAKPPEEWRAKTLDKLGNRFDLLQQRLGDKPFLAGDHFTVADAYAFVMAMWAPKFAVDMNRWPKLKAYYDRLAARPAVAETLRQEGIAYA